MNLDDLSDFLLVALHKGFAQASRKSGRPKASLSRKVMALESALGVRLFERGAKTIRLSEPAVLLERLLKRVKCCAMGIQSLTVCCESMRLLCWVSC